MAKQRNYVDSPGKEAAPPASGDADDVHGSDRVIDGRDDDDERLDDSSQMSAGREGAAREFSSRDGDAREMEDREVTDAERIETFKRSVFNSALPDLPPRKGFHRCWLTTTNPRDPVAGRLRVGYTLIRVADVPGFEHSVTTLTDYAGYVGVNEMLAAEIPLNLYHAYMQEAHHNAPLQEEERLKVVTQMIAEQAAQASGKMPEIGDGTAALGKGPPRGKFGDDFHSIAPVGGMRLE